MNPKRMVEILLTKASYKHNIFYLEQRTYKEGKVFKKYKVKIDNGKMQEFNSLTQLLIFLKDWKWWQLPKLTDRQKKKIIADYVENGNYSETARLNNTTDVTVRRVVEEDKDNVLKKVEQKKEENTQDMIQYLESKKEDKKRVIELCFKALEDKLASPDMFTSVRDIAMVYGIIVDKDLKIKEIEATKTNAENINKNISNIANLLNNPKPNRSDKDV